MSLAAGTQLGPHRINAPVGAREAAHRPTDARAERTVAIKRTPVRAFTTGRIAVTAVALAWGYLVGAGPSACVTAVSAQSTSTELGPASPTSSRRSRPVFRAGIDLVTLNVVVTDPDDEFVSGLDSSNFRVYEDGALQHVTAFSGDPMPLDLLILLDVSSSMTNALPLVRRAASHLVNVLRPIDRGAVITFNQRLSVLQRLTSDRAAIREALLRARPSGDTSFHTTLYVTLREFAKRAESTDVRRQAVVVLSDGCDTTSIIGFDQILDVARRTSIHVYTIALLSAERAAWPQPTKWARAISEAEYAMKALAASTGARAFFPTRVEELVAVYRDVAADLSHQYALGYESNNQTADGGFRQLAVHVVNRSGVRPRARTGYFAVSTPAPTGTREK